MEESQVRDPRRRNVGIEETRAEGGALQLRRVSYGDLAAEARRFESGLLGVVAYGSRKPPLARVAAPHAWVRMAALNGDAFCELWVSDEPVVRTDAHGISGAHNEHIVFGCLQIADQDTVEDVAESAYCRVFDYVDALGFPHLLRAWNYFPGINSHTQEMERYRRFNIGRHRAFAAKGRVIGENTPAASALGCRSGPLTVLFIAARVPGQPIENPRQVSAYRYPPVYGRRSPTFSRAMLHESAHQRVLFISGTASIIGHQTVHSGDVDAQTTETITNLRAILEESGYGGPWTGGHKALWLKAYIRHPQHAPRVQSVLERAFNGAEVVCVRSDICRSDLLVEVEATCLERTTS